MTNCINMAKRVKGVNAISAKNVGKLLLKLSIPYTTVAAVSEEEVRIVLQAHTEGSSLRGISRISGLAYDTVVSIVQAAARKAQMVHNAEVQAVDTDAIGADELWSFVEKNKNTACPKKLKLEIAG